MSEKKTIDLAALIVEAMRGESSLMPCDHPNGVTVDTLSRVENDPATVTIAGYWVSPDNEHERYYIEANVKVEATCFAFSPPDGYWADDDEG